MKDYEINSSTAQPTTTPLTPEPPLLSPATKLGKVALIVSDLQRSIDFYAGVIGLAVLDRHENSAQLGVAQENRLVLELEHRTNVRRLTARRQGLYHFALLLPSRAQLSSFAEHLQQRGLRAGMSDHLVSEAFYLQDPDGLEVEVYADRDREQWTSRNGQLVVATRPLNLPNLLNVPHQPWEGVPFGSTIGHVHFYVDDLGRAEVLYRQGLGLNVRSRSLPGALFLAAGDYHHHVGLNTWAGNVPAAGETDARLSFWELHVQPPDLAPLRQRMLHSGWQSTDGTSFVDPWGLAVRLAL